VLLGSKRAGKLPKIERVRARQRRCALRMLAMPGTAQSKAMRRVAGRVQMGEKTLRQYEEDEDCAQVYVHVNPRVRHSY
jgi:hypothetical protein